MKNRNFNPFPELTTERLLLRELYEEDIDALFSLRSDSRINKYIEREPPKDQEEIKTFLQKIKIGIETNNWIYWAICLKEQPTLIGTICLWNFSENYSSAELGYELSVDHQGNGIMNEALEIVVDYGFNKVGLLNMEAYSHKENLASKRLLIKNKFILDPVNKDEQNPNNEIYFRNK